MSWHVIDAANERLADTATYLFEALASATDRDTLEFLVLGAPREVLAVIRSLDHDGILSDVPPASEHVGGGSRLDTSTAPASGDGQRNRNAADLPGADDSRQVAEA